MSTRDLALSAKRELSRRRLRTISARFSGKDTPDVTKEDMQDVVDRFFDEHLLIKIKKE